MENYNPGKIRIEQEKFQLDKFRLLREEIRHEYNMTAQRVSWYLTSQSFFILSFANAATHKFYTFCMSVNLLGAILSVLVNLPISASRDRIIRIHKKVGNSFDENKDGLRPEFFPIADLNFLKAVRYGRYVPLSILIFWVLMAYFIKEPYYCLITRNCESLKAVIR